MPSSKDVPGLSGRLSNGILCVFSAPGTRNGKQVSQSGPLEIIMERLKDAVRGPALWVYGRANSGGDRGLLTELNGCICLSGCNPPHREGSPNNGNHCKTKHAEGPSGSKKEELLDRVCHGRRDLQRRPVAWSYGTTPCLLGRGSLAPRHCKRCERDLAGLPLRCGGGQSQLQERWGHTQGLSAGPPTLPVGPPLPKKSACGAAGGPWKELT